VSSTFENDQSEKQYYRVCPEKTDFNFNSISDIIRLETIEKENKTYFS